MSFRSQLIIVSLLALLFVLPLALVILSLPANLRTAAQIIKELEPENGVLSANTAIKNDVTASGGKYVQLGSSTLTKLVTASVRNDGMLILNDSPTFLFGFYHDADDGTHQGDFLDTDLKNIAAASYNMMHPAITDLANTTAYRNDAAALGVYTIAQFYKGTSAAITNTVTAMKNSPTIFGWDIADDFNFPYSGPKPASTYQSYRDQIKAIAPGHLTYGAGGGFPGSASVTAADLASYKDVLDVIGIESYPVGNKDGNYATEMEDSIAYYLYAREQLPQSHAILALPQTYAWPGQRWPNPQELRNMTYGALIARMNGVLYYTYWSADGYLPNQSTLFDEAKKLGADLSSLQTVLTNGVFTGYDSGSGSHDGTGRIHAAFWQYQGKTYVIIINTATTTKTANFPLPPGVSGVLQPLFANDTRYDSNLTISGNAITGTLAAYAVHAYVITTIPSPTPSPNVANYPPDTTLTAVSNPSVSQPTYLGSITDPVFTTKIIRIGDETAMNLVGKKYLRHAYAKIQPWNSDESYVYLDYTYPAPLLDGKTYKFLRLVHQPSYAVWSNTNPSLTYGTQSPNIFVSHDMNADTQFPIYTFPQYTYLGLGEGEGNLSDDDHYVALYAKNASNVQFVILFDIPNKVPVATITLPNTTSSQLNWTGVDHDGSYIIIGWNQGGTSRYQGIEQYDLQGNFIRQLTTAGGWHGDFAKDVNGDSVYVEGSDCSTQSTSEQCSIVAQVSAYKLDGSGSYPVVARTVNGKKFDNSMHVSGRNTKRPGWIYLSDFGPNDSTTYINYDEVDAVKLDPSVPATNPAVERFAHTHHTYNIGYDYQPHAVPNRDGSRVMFASDWGLGTNPPVYSYVVSKN